MVIEKQLSTGINDKTLAEFVIALHGQSKTLPDFKKKLQEVGAEFPDSFIDNIDRLILNTHPKHKKTSLDATSKFSEANVSGDPTMLSEKEKTARLFPGLSRPDQEWRPSNEFDGLEKDANAKEVDDLMSQLEGVASKRARNRPTAGDFMDSTEPPSPKRRRPNSPPRQARRRSPSPPRGRTVRGDYSMGHSQSNGRHQLDSAPLLYKIYNGRVSTLKEFGAFIQLEGVAGRVEGMLPYELGKAK